MSAWLRPQSVSTGDCGGGLTETYLAEPKLLLTSLWKSL